uniref:Uncharacterized protein n=1 Tax=Arundo donax TaxID=35708 RepID=A0A0A9GYM0_ARUDO
MLPRISTTAAGLARSVASYRNTRKRTGKKDQEDIITRCRMSGTQCTEP